MPGMPLEDYETLEKLGTGTYGEVFLVRCKNDKRKVLIFNCSYSFFHFPHFEINPKFWRQLTINVFGTLVTLTRHTVLHVKYYG